METAAVRNMTRLYSIRTVTSGVKKWNALPHFLINWHVKTTC